MFMLGYEKLTQTTRSYKGTKQRGHRTTIRKIQLSVSYTFTRKHFRCTLDTAITHVDSNANRLMAEGKRCWSGPDQRWGYQHEKHRRRFFCLFLIFDEEWKVREVDKLLRGTGATAAQPTSPAHTHMAHTAHTARTARTARTRCWQRALCSTTATPEMELACSFFMPAKALWVKRL